MDYFQIHPIPGGRPITTPAPFHYSTNPAMKKFLPTSASLFLILSLCLLLTAMGCRRTSHNGKLDGQWHITEIQYTQTGQSVIPEREYICINLELMELFKSPASGEEVRQLAVGEISYDKHQKTLGVKFRQGTSADDLQLFGITTNPVTFRIEHLSGSSLVLATPETTITAKRF